jgi:hypothetical protein
VVGEDCYRQGRRKKKREIKSLRSVLLRWRERLLMQLLWKPILQVTSWKKEKELRQAVRSRMAGKAIQQVSGELCVSRNEAGVGVPREDRYGILGIRIIKAENDGR